MSHEHPFSQERRVLLQSSQVLGSLRTRASERASLVCAGIATARAASAAPRRKLSFMLSVVKVESSLEEGVGKSGVGVEERRKERVRFICAVGASLRANFGRGEAGDVGMKAVEGGERQ